MHHPSERVQLRQAHARSILDQLEAWLQAQLAAHLRQVELAKAIRCALTRIKKLRPYLDRPRRGRQQLRRAGGEIRGARPEKLPLRRLRGRRQHAAAIAYTLIETAKLNGIDPQAWLTDTTDASPTTRSTRSTNSCRGLGRNTSRHRVSAKSRVGQRTLTLDQELTWDKTVGMAMRTSVGPRKVGRHAFPPAHPVFSVRVPVGVGDAGQESSWTRISNAFPTAHQFFCVG
ncbi:MAG: transposase domain-containing protein [Geminicoccaceae bacterium]